MTRKTFVCGIAFVLILSVSAGAQQKKEEPAKKPATGQPAAPTTGKEALPAKKEEPAKKGEPVKAPEPGKQPAAGQPPAPTVGKDAPPSKKEEAKPPAPPKETATSVSGTAVDISKKSIKIKDAAGLELEFSITPKTVVKKGTETKKPKDIEKGAFIEVSAKGKDAETIVLLPPPPPQVVKFGGSVDDVDLKKKTIKVRDAVGKVSSFKLTDKTVIKAGDAAKKPEDIKKGDKVEIEAKGDTLEMVNLPVPLELSMKVKGKVEDVDVKAKTIKVKDDKGMIFAFEVPEKTDIKTGKDVKKLADIKKGDSAEVEGKGKAAQSILFESLSAITAKEIKEASKDIESARKEGAETLASELFEEAVGLLKKAEEEVKKEKYDWAVDDAKAAKQRAIQASQMATSVLTVLK